MNNEPAIEQVGGKKMTSTSRNIPLDPTTEKRVQRWLKGDYDDKSKDHIRRLLQDNPSELIDAFYTTLSFGTGGLRGIMGVGSNRMNVYTVQFATQGLANYLRKVFPDNDDLSVFIGYDCRHNSRRFAEESAQVLAGNGIKTFLCRELRPTPLVSFGCRHYGCSAAIMITASHNPPEYNGYKVYWSDGGQILPPHDKGIIDEVSAIEAPAQVKRAPLDAPLIIKVGQEVDKAYLQAITPLQHYPEQNTNKSEELRIVFSNLHGTANTLVPKALQAWGFKELLQVKEQEHPDGDFPTVASPNPEDPEALELGISRLLETEADLFLATDPDTDRVGAVIRHNNEAVRLSGNQTACICLYHICEALEAQGKLGPHTAFVKTIVTSELFRTIAESYACPCFDTLTGFKYIAEKIREWESDPENQLQYIFGGEESYGYLLGTHARDKDAVITCCLICEAALHAKLQGMTLVDVLHKIYHRHGIYRERLVSLKFPETKEGREQMTKALVELRAQPPKELAGTPITAVEDYQSSQRTELLTGKQTDLSLPRSNVLRYHLSDGCWVVVRPSGTEPKVKLYAGAVQKQLTLLESNIAECEAHLDTLMDELQQIIQRS